MGGAKEQLYHPKYYRTVTCRDLQLKGCPRQQLCAFFHRRSERRALETDNVDYAQPLRKEVLPADWAAYFLSPPFFQEVADGEEGGKGGRKSSHPSARSMPKTLPYDMAGAWGPAEVDLWSEWNGMCSVGGMLQGMGSAAPGLAIDETPETHPRAAPDDADYPSSEQADGEWPVNHHAMWGGQAMMWGCAPAMWNAEAPSYEQLNEEGQPCMDFYPGTGPALQANGWWGPTH